MPYKAPLRVRSHQTSAGGSYFTDLPLQRHPASAVQELRLPNTSAPCLNYSYGVIFGLPLILLKIHLRVCTQISNILE